MGGRGKENYKAFTLLARGARKSRAQKIADLVQKSHEARLKAKQLLELAKNKVEELVESKKINLWQKLKEK